MVAFLKARNISEYCIYVSSFFFPLQGPEGLSRNKFKMTAVGEIFALIK